MCMWDLPDESIFVNIYALKNWLKCNAYVRLKWARRLKFKSWSSLFAFSDSTYIFEKEMISTILTRGNQEGRQVFLT